MRFKLTYSEIEGAIVGHTGKKITLSYSSYHSVRVGYEVNILFKNSNIGIDLTIEQIQGSDLLLSFNGGAGIDYMLKMALNQAKGKPGAEMLELVGDNMLRLCLSKNPQASQLFEHVTLNDIYFDEQDVTIDFTPKALAQ